MSENSLIPDFSPDEFDNDKEVKQWRKQEEEFVSFINSCVQSVAVCFQATKSSHRNLKEFRLHKRLDTPFIIESYTGHMGRKEVFFSVIQYHTATRAGKVRSEGTDNYFAGVITLEKSYPHTIIVPETTAQKIQNLFVPGDIDFKHAKKFSFLFHVMTQDEQQLKMAFEMIDLSRLNRFRTAEIEIIKNECYFRASKKPVSVDEAKHFSDLAKTIGELF